MNVVVGSAFRNSSHNARRYMQRVVGLRQKLGATHFVRVIAAEGDSTDGTRDALESCAEEYGLRLDVVDCAHGGPVYGSTEQPERMKALSKVGNAIFDSVEEQDDVLFYVESDLLWDADTAYELCFMALYRHYYDVFAPKIMAGTAFYDIWGFRHLDGRRFSPFEEVPGHVEVSSVGSCFAVNGDTARACRIRNDNALVGWCEDVRAHGRHIVALGNLTVVHP